ncbi:MAG: glycosyltransferase family 87 protein [Myxococcota bacterium]
MNASNERPSRLGALLDPGRPFGVSPVVAASAVWAVAFIVMVSLRFTDTIHGKSYAYFEGAGLNWINQEPLYDMSTFEGFQYFPQAAIVFAPFAALGFPWGNVLWRVLMWTLLLLGVRRLSAELVPTRRDEAFLIATCLAIGPAVGPLGNGQANLLLAALGLHVAADVAQKRWWRAAVTAVFGVAMKPLFAVLALLVSALYRPLGWRIAVGLAVAFFVPWLVADSAYVVEQYAALPAKLRLGAKPIPMFEDMRGIAITLGWTMPHDVATALRIVAALATLGITLVARRRVREPYAVTLVVGLAAAYLMVFNPRTQSTSYAIPGAVVAVLAALYWFEGRTRALLAAVAIQVAFTLNHNYIPPIELWLRPLAAIALGLFLTRESFRPPSRYRSTS